MTTEAGLLNGEADGAAEAAGRPWAPRFRPLDLSGHRDNIGITHPADTESGAFNIWRNSLPAGELPAGRSVVVEGVPFDFPPVAAGRPDNVRCAGQFVAVPPGRYDWLYLLAAAERRVEDEIALHFTGGAVEFAPLRVSDFWHAPAVFGEYEAFATATMHYPYHVQKDVSAKIWCQRVPVIGRGELTAARLPVNTAVHIFAATLDRRDAGDRP